MDFRHMLKALREGVDARLWKARTADLAKIVEVVSTSDMTAKVQPLSRRRNAMTDQWDESKEVVARYIPVLEPVQTPDTGGSGNQSHTHPTTLVYEDPVVGDLGLLVYLDSAIPSTSSSETTPVLRQANPGTSGVLILFR